MPDKVLNDLDLSENVYASGVINAADDDIIVDVGGAPNARLSFAGTFTGILEITGFDNYDTKIRGGRLLFLSGFGSRGVYSIEGKGSALSLEGAVCCGSRYLSIRPIAWTSGSVNVSVFTSDSPFMVFVNGSVNTPEDEAIRAGRAFLAGVSNFPVAANEKLDFTLENPAGNDKNLFLTERLFGHDQTQVLRYRAFAGTIVDLANTAPAINRSIGNSNASNAIFKYEKRAVAAAALGSVEGSGEPIHPNAIRERKLLAILPPGSIVGFSINGSGNNIAQSSNLYTTLQWYEEPAI